MLLEVRQRGDSLIALDLAFPEAANAIWKRYHRRLATLSEVQNFLDSLIAVPIRVAPALPLLRAAMDIATRYDRSVYDALFVALVADLGLTGVTADEPLYSAVHADIPQIVLLRDWVPRSPPKPAGRPDVV